LPGSIRITDTRLVRSAVVSCARTGERKSFLIIETRGSTGSTATLARVAASAGACANAYEDTGKNNRLKMSAIQIACLSRSRRSLAVNNPATVLKRAEEKVFAK